MNTKTLTLLITLAMILAACQPIVQPQENASEKVCDVNDPESCPKEDKEEGVLDNLEEKEETKVEEKPSEEFAKIVEVNEGQLVSLKPKAFDPDKDKVVFTFTNPLSKDGEWQTKPGDAGEYVVTVTASDGKLQTVKKVKIVVKKVNIPPMIKAMPKELKVKEGDVVKIVVSAIDQNEDKLHYQINNEKFDQNDNVFTWQTSYGDAGKYLVEVTVSDGVAEIVGKTELIVDRNNVAPVIDPLPDLNVKEGDEVVVTVKAHDPNNDKVIYSLSDGRFTQEKNIFTWKTTYTDNGDYRIEVRASDGEMMSSRFFRLRIEDVNQPPEILDIE
ncbi:MAG: PKD domain-containing protein [Candidatus Woesearchaeota archaeon]